MNARALSLLATSALLTVTLTACGASPETMEAESRVGDTRGLDNVDAGATPAEVAEHASRWNYGLFVVEPGVDGSGEQNFEERLAKWRDHIPLPEQLPDMGNVEAINARRYEPLDSSPILDSTTESEPGEAEMVACMEAHGLEYAPFEGQWADPEAALNFDGYASTIDSAEQYISEEGRFAVAKLPGGPLDMIDYDPSKRNPTTDAYKKAQREACGDLLTEETNSEEHPDAADLNGAMQTLQEIAINVVGHHPEVVQAEERFEICLNDVATEDQRRELRNDIIEWGEQTAEVKERVRLLAEGRARCELTSGTIAKKVAAETLVREILRKDYPDFFEAYDAAYES